MDGGIHDHLRTATGATAFAPDRADVSAGQGAVHDWCAVTRSPDLPADPDAVLGFLAGLPTTRSALVQVRQRCRVAAIDHHHAGAGLFKPGARCRLTCSSTRFPLFGVAVVTGGCPSLATPFRRASDQGVQTHPGEGA